MRSFSSGQCSAAGRISKSAVNISPGDEMDDLETVFSSLQLGPVITCPIFNGGVNRTVKPEQTNEDLSLYCIG